MNMVLRKELHRLSKTETRKTVHGHITKEKCVREGWIVSKLIEDIDDTELVLKVDGETALVQVINEVERQIQHEAMLEDPPAYDITKQYSGQNSEENERCSKAIEHISAAVNTPVSKKEEIAKPESGESSVVLEQRYLKNDRISEGKDRQRMHKCFRNMSTVVTPGCDAAVGPMERSAVTPHKCRKRLEEAMNADEVDQERIRRRSGRMTGNGRADRNTDEEVKMDEEEKPEGEKKGN